MATALPGYSYTRHRIRHFGDVQVLGAGGARLLRQGSDVLAQAIDWSLTAAFLLTDLVLAASLAATAAGVALSPPP